MKKIILFFRIWWKSKSIRYPLMKAFNLEYPSLESYFTGFESKIKEANTESSPVKNSWDTRKNKIIEELKKSPATFLRQETIGHALHPNQQELANLYLEELKKNSFSVNYILPKLHDIPFGDPFLCTTFPLASPLSIQHAYYLFIIQKYLQLFIPVSKIKKIIDIGGGYGNFCRLIYNYGYTGNYVIADMPEIHAVQAHYLSEALSPETLENRVAFTTLFDLPEHLAIDDINDMSILIATFSLNEMPLETRILVEKTLLKFDYIFIAYNKVFDGVDNELYFEKLVNELQENFKIQRYKDQYRPAWFIFARKIQKQK